MLEVSCEFVRGHIHLEINRLSETRNDIVVSNEVSLDHRVDIAPIVGVEARELADDDVDHTHRGHLEVPKFLVELLEWKIDGSLAAERHSAPDDVDVHATSPMDDRVRT